MKEKAPSDYIHFNRGVIVIVVSLVYLVLMGILYISDVSRHHNYAVDDFESIQYLVANFGSDNVSIMSGGMTYLTDQEKCLKIFTTLSDSPELQTYLNNFTNYKLKSAFSRLDIWACSDLSLVDNNIDLESVWLIDASNTIRSHTISYNRYFAISLLESFDFKLTFVLLAFIYVLIGVLLFQMTDESKNRFYKVSYFIKSIKRQIGLSYFAYAILIFTVFPLGLFVLTEGSLFTAPFIYIFIAIEFLLTLLAIFLIRIIKSEQESTAKLLLKKLGDDGLVSQEEIMNTRKNVAKKFIWKKIALFIGYVVTICVGMVLLFISIIRN